MQLLHILAAYTLLVLVLSWPSFNKDRKSRVRGPNDEINTAMVHNGCCPVEDPRLMGPIISYPPAFTHEWNMYQMDGCYQNPDCVQPPYAVTPPPNMTRVMPGKTWYDSQYRGSSQKESYYNTCIPIFPSFDPPTFSCDFYLITQENKAYMATKDAPEEFGECCILAQPFHPPARDFTKHFKYNGIKSLGNSNYHQYGVFIEESGGPFVHGFWVQLVEKYNPPNFFYMVGIDNKNLYQEFLNFTATKTFDSAEVFRLPQACKSPSIKFCPDFDFNLFKKTLLRTQ